MKIETLYDPGTAKPQEDEFIVHIRRDFGFVGVADGVSGLYMPGTGPQMFGNQTGGQMASCALVEAIATAIETAGTLIEIVYMASHRIRQKNFEARISAGISSELLAGTTFAMANIGSDEIRVATVGDAIAIWQTKNGSVHGTVNQVFNHDMEMRRVIADLMQKHGDRAKMWEEFGPFLAQKRRERINDLGQSGYGLLNGDPRVSDGVMFHTIATENLCLLLLFTDGLVPYPETGDTNELAKMILPLYEKGGLKAILARTREIEKAGRKESHIDHAEATGIAVEL